VSAAPGTGAGAPEGAAAAAPDWLAVCRAAVADLRVAFAALPTRALREPVVGAGEGGDDTTAVDAAAEAAILARLAAFHRESGVGFTVVSEEIGERAYGSGGPWRLVVDPIDGSLNAKRMLPYWSVSIAVATGPAMGDVMFGYVFDFSSGEEWWAVRGGGAFLDGARLGAERPKDEIEILAFEATRTALVAERAAAFVGTATRLRIMGSLALSLCNLAAGRVDGVVSLKPARSVDIAAAQLLCLEAGVAVDLFEAPPFAAAPLDLIGRSRLVAAATPAGCARLATALRA
jgi:myo-inositol-1(or 4)-monophosphatase